MLSKLNEWNDRFRFDAEFMKKEYLQIEANLESKPYKRLVELDCKILHPSEIKRDYLEEGEWFFRTQNLRPLKIEDSNNVFISATDAKKLSKNLIKIGDVLITRTGANFGQTAIYNKSKKALASSHVFIVRNSFFNQSYLAVFLNTKFGRKMIDKGMYGGSQPEIAPYYIFNIPIPIFSQKFQEKIEKILQDSESAITNSYNIYTQAEALLLKSLGLDNSPLEGESKQSLIASVGGQNLKTNSDFNSLASFSDPSPNAKRSTLPQGEGDDTSDLITLPLREGRFATQNGEGSSFDVGNPDKADKLSNLSINQKSFKESFRKTSRLDAEYYQPKYEKIVEHIKTQPYAKLSELVIIKKSIEPGSDEYSDDEEGLPFLRVADYNKFGITEPQKRLRTSFVSENRDKLDALTPKAETILFSKDGSVGEAYCLREDSNFITSGAVLHLTVRDKKKVLPDYLTLALNSKLVRMQAERDAGGSIILHWRVSEIEEVLIPLIDPKTQSQISSLIQESFTLKAKSEKLLEVAKKAVEMAIEESEEKAIKYLEKTDF